MIPNKSDSRGEVPVNPNSEEVADHLERRVFLARLDQYYGSLPASTAAVLINGALLVYLLIDPANQRAAGIWLGALLLLSAYRLTTLFAYRMQALEDRARHAGCWYMDVMLATSLSGLAWGAAGYVLYDAGDALNLYVLAVVLCGMMAGGMVSLSPFREASAIFLCLAALPFALRSLQEGTEQSTVMAILAVFYLLMMLIFSRRVSATVVAGFEMTHLRGDAERAVEMQALYDALTGLPNRRLLQDRLSQALAYVHREGGSAALLFLDLDHFKRVNDSLGHGVGDALLEEVAQRLRRFLREEDTAARLGGDEFVVLISRVHGDDDHVLSVIQRRGEELRAELERPVIIDGNQIHVSASIGVSMLPAHTEDLDDLLKHADTAMYQAKEDGRNTLRFFASDMQEVLERRLSLEKRLRNAVELGEFELCLQPQHREDRSICGAEFLLRWNHNGAVVRPDEFIPVAEDSGLIYRIGDWVVEEACRIASELLPEIREPGFSLALNVSPRQFRQKDFANTVASAVERYDLPPGLMELEITEGLLIDDVQSTAQKMLFLRETGLRFSIDDFGTGYSSLRYLKALPLDALKIDSSFVSDVLRDPAHATIVRTIISIAETLELEVIAEGVETEDIHRFLSDEGCPRFQGFYYSRPMSLDEFRDLLSAPQGALRAASA